MTCREKLAMENPECLGDEYPGGCKGCPSSHGYLGRPEECGSGTIDCGACWDREIPEKTDEPIEKITYHKVPFPDESLTCNERCIMCWNREIPEKKLTFEYQGERIAKVKDIIEENGGVTAVVEHTPAVQAWIEHMEEKESRILDSGNRTQFESGAVRDMREGKGRFDLVPLEVVGEIMGGPIILNLKNFLSSKDTTYLYNCLGTFSRVYDDGKTKVSDKKIYEQRYCSMFLEVAKHFEEGAKKYGENNWQKGIPVHCYIDSAVRHYLKWLRGDKDEPHDRAFVWNLMCCIWEVDYSPRATEETT